MTPSKQYDQVFDQNWFAYHQRKLLKLANSPLGKWAFGLDIDHQIDFILPGSLGWVENDGKIHQQFHPGTPHAKTLSQNLGPLWRAIHEWDMVVNFLDIPELNLGFDSFSGNPATGANSPCDGPVNSVARDQTFATIRSGAGNQGGLESTGIDNMVGIKASTTTDQFAENRRAFFNYDTSSIGSGATISSAIKSVVCNFKTNALGSDSYSLVTFAPASTAALPAGAFVTVTSTALATVSYAGIDSGGANYTPWDFTAQSSVVNLTGVTSLALRSEWDRLGVFGGVWASGAESRFQGRYTDAGSLKPKLDVIYTSGGVVSVVQDLIGGLGIIPFQR